MSHEYVAADVMFELYISVRVCLSVAEFATLGDMKNAITKLDGTELGGRKIRLNEDKSTSRRNR